MEWLEAFRRGEKQLQYSVCCCSGLNSCTADKLQPLPAELWQPEPRSLLYYTKTDGSDEWCIRTNCSLGTFDTNHTNVFFFFSFYLQISFSKVNILLHISCFYPLEPTFHFLPVHLHVKSSAPFLTFTPPFPPSSAPQRGDSAAAYVSWPVEAAAGCCRGPAGMCVCGWVWASADGRANESGERLPLIPSLFLVCHGAPAGWIRTKSAQRTEVALCFLCEALLLNVSRDLHAGVDMCNLSICSDYQHKAFFSRLQAAVSIFLRVMNIEFMCATFMAHFLLSFRVPPTPSTSRDPHRAGEI